MNFHGPCIERGITEFDNLDLTKHLGSQLANFCHCEPSVMRRLSSAYSLCAHCCAVEPRAVRAALLVATLLPALV